MQLTYRVRAYPTRKQHAMFADYLEHTRQLYNAALEERIDCYRKTRRTITNNEQSRGLTALREDAGYARYPRRLQRWAINLVETAYKGMFARHRKSDKLGVPRFRGRMFWDTIGWDSPIDFKMCDRGICGRKSFGGTLRLRPGRELPPFDACTSFTLCRDGDRWFAHLTYERPDPEIKATPKRPVGIDLGLKVLAMRSDGVPMNIARQDITDTADQRRASRALSRCKRRSRRRIKVRARLRRVNARIARKRKARLHVVSARLTHHFDAIAVEDLKIAGINRGGGGGAAGRGIRKSWRDRAPGLLLEQLAWKAIRDGRARRKVDPRGTTIDCAICGAAVPKTLRDRMHICECGAVLNRDHNAALNILARAGWGPGDAKEHSRSEPSSGEPSATRRVGLSRKHGKASRTTDQGVDTFLTSITTTQRNLTHR